MENTQSLRQSFTLIPINQELVQHVKRLDSLNVNTIFHQFIHVQEEELANLKGLLSVVAQKDTVLSLLDFELEHINGDETQSSTLLQNLLDQLTTKGGLDYVPRERTPQGRMFEHASDSVILLKHLQQTKPVVQLPEIKGITYYIRVEHDQNLGLTPSSSVSTDLSSQDQTITDSNESSSLDKRVILTIQKKFITLNLNSNGKADLYFHAYVWLHILLNTFLHANPQSIEQDFDTQIVSTSIEVRRLKGLVESIKKVEANLQKFPFNKEIYDRFVSEFGGRKQIKKLKLIEDIQRSLFVAQISDDKQTLYWIEKILIQLLGYHDMSMRDQAVVLLNMLYDGIDWQLTQAFRPVVRVVGQHFKVNLIVNLDLNQKENQNSQIFIGLSAPTPVDGINKSILTWHKIDKRNIVNQKGIETEIMINFGKFWKCGFYDWRLVLVKDTGRLQPLEIIGRPEPSFPTIKTGSQSYYDDDDQLGQIAQGRFIVHAKGIKDQIFHEVQVDFQDAEVDTKKGTFIKRGDFSKVENAIEQYKGKGITSLYLMGALERDNYPQVNKMTNETEYRKPDSNPLAITCRQTANKMLGGDEGFQKVMTQAKKNKVKIIIDCLTRISSGRNHRKYRDLMLHYLDEEGRKKICYGTDGQSINYEDTALLNYRKVDSWNLLIEEVMNFTTKHGINGIHLDNGQAWPQIMETDLEELMRLDVDGEPAYTPEDLMNGEIVLRNENNGYWNTSTMEQYPNPFFIKMAKALWEKIPDFMIIGECWGGFMFENRQIILARSGIIPRLFKLPQAISSLFGKKLHKDGRVTNCERENVLALKKWYESNRLFLPEGSILIQSSTAHQWPYPAYLYGKGSWAAVDILYFMPDIPITFNGEIDGEVYRVGTTQLFQHEQQETNKSGLKRTNSQLMMALQKRDENDDYVPQQQQNQSPEGKRSLPRVRSGSNLAAVVQEQKAGEDLKLKEDQFKSQIGPQQGFDLTKISSHYEHRRRLRREKMVLRYGELIPLVAKQDSGYGWHNHVLSYARYSLLETAIISTNLNDSDVTFYVDTNALQQLYKKSCHDNTVIMISDCLAPDLPPQYYFLREYLQMKHYQTLKPYHSSIQCLTICQDDNFVIKKALTQSIERTKAKLQNGENIESEQISSLFTEIIEKTPEDIAKFANIVGSLQENFLDKLGLSFNDLFVNNHKLKNDPNLASKLLALCIRIVEISDDQALPPQKAAQSVVQSNKLGPIVFCAPELGRWSTVGGLGVMVDELAYGLALLGQDVYVISPYYERNRKGETGYLAKDPAGINYTGNITVSIGGATVLGVHEGEVNGVKVIFLHNGEIFPSAYPDVPPAEMVRQLAVFGKGCLEFCCARQIIPSICITNDWFTGLIPGYAKIGAFGDTFKGTTFFHIAHNLEPTYEGRIFPAPNQGALETIHQLPRDWLVDPLWSTCIINPSRIAIMLSDQWGTVSPSYKQDLLNTSTLRGLLSQKEKPFAFPNGIPVAARIKKLDDAAPDHLSAKRIIQKKYFNFADLDDEVCLLSFVGRVTEQKGVHLILDGAEALIQKYNYRINILIGGMANIKEPYSAECARKMWHLKSKYPNCFWADPNYFFTDGSVVNRGSDYGLMPSIFEPGGIVQHEFFVGATPVIAYKTGGLKDSVFEFMWDSEQGNGYNFEAHKVNDFIFACDRAIGTFKNKNKYMKLRQNAFNSVMDGEKVSKAWLAEFYRLRGKVYVEETIIQDALNKMKLWAPEIYKPMSSIEEMFGIERKLNFALEDIDFGAEEEKEVFEEDKTVGEKKKVVSHFESQTRNEDRFPHVFMMHNNGPRYSKVELCGSMDEWKVRHPMSFDHFTNQWFITLHLKRGKYHYKYVVNEKNWIMNDKEPKEKDAAGNMNNVLNL